MSAPHKHANGPRVAILAYDGIALFELGCAVELFCLKRPEISGWYRGEVVHFDEGTLASTANLCISARRVSRLHNIHTLVIPSWPTDGRAPPATVARAICNFAQRGGRVLSFCSGAFLLAELGLLDGRQATTHWRYGEVFQQRFPALSYVENVLYIYDGKVGCSAGSASALDLGLEVIRGDFGHEVASQVARRLVMSPHRSGGQSQYADISLPKRTGSLAEVLAWATEKLANGITVQDIANRAHMSRRSFDRHFRATMAMAPLAWLTREKLRRAQWLLESTDCDIETIAVESGFSNATTLRHNFQKQLGVSPSQYRAQFCQRL